jgi:hypothetical protein
MAALASSLGSNNLSDLGIDGKTTKKNDVERAKEKAARIKEQGIQRYK